MHGVVNGLVERFSELPLGGVVMFNDYVANFDAIHGIRVRNQICRQVLDDLKTKLINQGFRDLTNQVDLESSSRQWAILERT